MSPVDTPEIGIDQLAEAVRDGATIVDVREPGEYAAGHVPGAVLIPMGQLPRRTAELVADCGLELTRMDNYYMEGPKPFGYLFEGRAVKA